MIRDLFRDTLTGALLIALALSVLLGGFFYLDSKAKARRIEELEPQVAASSANETAAKTRGEALESVRIVYRDMEREIENAPPTPAECLADDRLRLTYDALHERRRVRDAN